MPWRQHWREDLFGKFPVDWNDVVDLFLPQIERPSDERENISSRFKIKNLIEDRSVYDSLVYCVNIRHFDKDIPAELQTGPWTYNFNSLEQTAPLQTAEMDDVRFVRLKGLNGFDLAYKDPDNIKRHSVNGDVFFESNDHDATGFYAVIVKLRFESKVVTVIRFAFMVFGSTVDESIDSLPSKVDGRWLFPFRFLLNRLEYFKEAETHGISDYVLNSVSLIPNHVKEVPIREGDINKRLHFFSLESILWYGHLENSNVLFNQVYFRTTQSFKQCNFGYVEPMVSSEELVNFRYVFRLESMPPFIDLDSVMGKGCMGLFTTKTNFQPYHRPYRFHFMDKNFWDPKNDGKKFHAIFRPEELWIIWNKIRTGVPYIYLFCDSIVNSSQFYLIRLNDEIPTELNNEVGEH